eukprot:CAMPEP_0176420778 /NCGR_PEP_ID=MMETSP0127-20121128/8794_1 /TAXON_ID=938130 /ORGANISM="Platyophrya macrostoma, Strain WH" /LENGTH=441 /DNA_ID=CAMNT_0017801409 /DNA_START=154 /DNA_END=1479 /DNA_ORIENTATION=-
MIKLAEPSLNMKNLKTEVAIMQNLKYPHIINLIEFHETAEYYKKSGKVDKVVAIVMELARGGELFEYVANTGRFDEVEARTYFHQLIDTIEFCHNQGFSHRDLKPENLLFDSDFNLKVADFGFSTLLAGKDGSGQLHTVLGTESYMAPEIHLKQPYSGSAVDLFACAIILFIMVSGTPPFLKAEPKDSYYKLICVNRHSMFWDAHEKSKEKPSGKNFFSDDFRNLMNSMLSLDPAQRLSLAEVKAHPWYKGKTSTVQDIKFAFLQRKKAVDNQLGKQKEEKKNAKIQKAKQEQNLHVGAGAYQGFKPYRDIPVDNDELESIQKKGKFDPNAKRTLEQYEEDIDRTSTCLMYSVTDADVLLRQLVVICDQVFNDYSVLEDGYKIKGRILTDEYGAIDLNMVIKKVDDETNVIEFNRKKGAIMAFYDTVNKQLKAPLEKINAV